LYLLMVENGGKYLYIYKDKDLVYDEDKSCFEENKFKEVSAYDFIASQGQQEWLR